MPTRRTFSIAAAAVLAAACRNGQRATPEEQAPTGWRRAPDAPYAVQEIYPALYRGGIWIAGGFAPLAAFGATQRVIVFDIARNRWREGPSLPTPAHHVHLAALNDELWAIGGYLGGENRRSWICTPRVLKLDGERWVEGPSLPKPIAEAAPIVHQGRIHLIGGRSPVGASNTAWDDQIDVNDHFVFAPGASQWERAAPLPMARNSAAVAGLGGTIHVISGRTVANGQTAAHHIYDARSGAWREGPAYPEPRGGLAAATFNGAIVAGGGEIFDPPSVGTALYRFENEAWSRFETLPVSRHGHGFVVAANALYAVGGAERVSANGTLARVDVLQPPHP